MAGFSQRQSIHIVGDAYRFKIYPASAVPHLPVGSSTCQSEFGGVGGHLLGFSSTYSLAGVCFGCSPSFNLVAPGQNFAAMMCISVKYCFAHCSGTVGGRQLVDSRCSINLDDF